MNTISSEQAEQIILLFVDRFISKDYVAMLDLFDEEVIFEFPYVPKPHSKQLVGKAALQQHLEMLEKMIEITSFTTPIVHVSANSPVFFAQFEGSGTLLAEGKPYEQQYISVVELRDGKIVRYQDYWNPLAMV
ncbi:nuclear transport factor 2 family protein [Paenibacillus psychroresistens]|uniref:Nuclear transport factor 2 family protein n=1 Tax=Paenibacillus psychroresistens TaxID=1778678 RepID=A0A6B8RXR7_9BACL|nr:nuclear transport factor 2 family protein [Paenibacillus psychroresistens]QGQ99798.1 nuclear transport factor 2 family protein [Paenibacillus psychroresistens]